MESQDFNNRFHYRSVIGKLNYSAGLTQPDIQYVVRACAIFSANSTQEHGETIEYIVQYLMGTQDIGMKLQPNKKDAFQVYADADFLGNWIKNYAELDPATAKS